MIRSMTGFGRASFEVCGLAFDLEIRTVNHRHLDVRIKLPRLLTGCELDLKGVVQSRLQRGKVDVTVSSVGEASSSTVEIDTEVAGQYIDAASDLEQRGVKGSLEVGTLMTLPGVIRFTERDIPAEELESALAGALARGLDAVEAMRVREGESLMRDFDTRLTRVSELVSAFEQRSGFAVEAARERLRKRSQQIQSDTGLLDEARLHQEVVIAADRMDISEELVRLRSHVDQFRAILAEASAEVPVGRRMDFLLQELGREANTVGSKVADAPLAHDVVELKTELERIREQVQNVE